jgi:hypothetical protein
MHSGSDLILSLWNLGIRFTDFYFCSTERRMVYEAVAYPGIFSGGSTNSVEDRGQINVDMGAVAP